MCIVIVNAGENTGQAVSRIAVGVLPGIVGTDNVPHNKFQHLGELRCPGLLSLSVVWNDCVHLLCWDL